ncbi:major pollen allergen Lol p 11-like [Punica granatum]|uniref:Uncharacterized protein n=2 Tax=Punica granatum TaxID=22663 RepID=A0A218X6D5_PUNGR|nr:major pollen allergen Lol p 11-like [Punica granatum]OWM79932.1 hypothetical protein CDL15_Pgr006236 [Punica granatum]PKI73881.1 hypothetical protein CRG98_005751 [Punica granatum]
MAKLALLFALFVLPAIAVAARPTKHPLVVRGRVYCDPCKAGFETSASTFIAGAKVKVECRHRQTSKLLYSREATTDSTGTYVIPVSEDHKDECCDAMLVSSPHPTCNIPTEGRDKARVILTRNNGICTDDRFANSMGFMTAQPMAVCAQILQQYQEFDD